MRNTLQTYVEELFAWFMIFQGKIEQRLRQHKSSVQGVLPCSLYNSSDPIIIIGPYLELGLLITSVIAY